MPEANKHCGTMPVTFNLDDDVSLQVQPLIMALRRNGYKGVSRTFLLNNALRRMVKDFKDGGVDDIKTLIKCDYDVKIASRNNKG